MDFELGRSYFHHMYIHISFSILRYGTGDDPTSSQKNTTRESTGTIKACLNKHKNNQQQIEIKDPVHLGSWYLYDYSVLYSVDCEDHNWSCDTFYGPGGTYLSQRHLGDDGQHYLFSFGGIWILLVFVQPGLEGGRWLAGGIFSTRGQVVARPIPDNWKGLTYVHMMKLTHTKLEIETDF